MRNYLLLILCCLFLTACSDEIVSPEEAVKNLEQEFVEEIKVIQFAEIDDKKMIAVFEAATIEGSQEYYASILEMKKNKWQVVEAFNVGNPETAEDVQSAGNYLESGFVHPSDNSSKQYVFELPNHSRLIWVNVFD